MSGDIIMKLQHRIRIAVEKAIDDEVPKLILVGILETAKLSAFRALTEVDEIEEELGVDGDEQSGDA